MQKPTKPIGGTELAYNRLLELTDVSPINLMMSICHPELLSNDKPNILWEQLSYDQQNVALLQDPNFVNKLDAIVFVSHWQHEQFRKRFPLDNTRCYVIPNAVDTFIVASKPRRIKLVYTSTPFRGLHLLIEALKRLDRDVDVDIYSGTSIYGPSFAQQTQGQFDHLYQAIKDLGYNHYEYAPNSTIRSMLERAHILAYPCVFEETSCIAAIEALSAGCKVVTTNIGALYETCNVWADYVPLSNDFIDSYTNTLRHSIDTFWDNQTERTLQQAFYKRFWSWDTRIKSWEKLINEFR